MGYGASKNVLVCLRKHRFETRTEAERGMAALLESRQVPPLDRRSYRAYACFCGGWHFGRRPRRAGLPLRDRARA